MDDELRKARDKANKTKNRAGTPEEAFLGWSYEARDAAAIRAVVDDGQSITGAAKKYGLSINAFRKRVHAERARREDRLLEAAETMAVGKKTKSAKREMPPFEEFVNTYFGHWECPDCEEQHPMPDFHKEIIDVLDGPSLRNVILTPPYHAKSTLVTVWRTVYKICEDRNYRLLLISKAGPLAEAFLFSITELLQNPDLYLDAKRNLIEDYGPFFDSPGSYAKTKQIMVSGRTLAEKDPTVLAVGIDSQIYGRRADEVIFDDVADVESSRNPDRVQKLLSQIDREALSRIGRKSRAIWIGTRVGPGDVYSFLLQRSTYNIIKYSCILDETAETTLWPEHLPFDAAILKRSEMDPASWQLIYQNVDAFGAGNSFTEEQLATAKDEERIMGIHEPQWRLIAGVDPAGATKNSGVTSLCLLGVDPSTGHMHVVDHLAQKSMPAWRIKEVMLDWSNRYPIYEWIVEGNALQQQIFAQDRGFTQQLAIIGTRLKSHQTTGKKWDPQHGVESLGPLFGTGLLKIPWGSATTVKVMQPLMNELQVFPLAATTDRVMSLWFAVIGCRDVIQRGHLPMFDNKGTKNWPTRIKNRRRIIDPRAQSVRNVRGHDTVDLPRKFVNINA